MTEDLASITADLLRQAQERVTRARAEVAAAEAHEKSVAALVAAVRADAGAVARLSGNAGLAYGYITTNPGRTGEEIATAIGCSPDTFRHLVSKLKAVGVSCRTYNGGGYFPPDLGGRSGV